MKFIVKTAISSGSKGKLGFYNVDKRYSWNNSNYFPHSSQIKNANLMGAFVQKYLYRMFSLLVRRCPRQLTIFSLHFSKCFVLMELRKRKPSTFNESAAGGSNDESSPVFFLLLHRTGPLFLMLSGKVLAESSLVVILQQI